LFNATYYVNAASNTNISPGFPRALRAGLSTTFCWQASSRIQKEVVPKRDVDRIPVVEPAAQ
jgi:hypothetical protein